MSSKKRSRSKNKPAKSKRRYNKYQKGQQSQLVKHAEVKYFDNNALVDSSATTGSITKDSICLVPLGDDPQARDGRKILITKVQLRYILQLDAAASATETADIARVIVFLDTECNGTAATPGDILESTDVLSYRNELSGGRFKFLSDKFYSLNTLAAINLTRS